MTSSLIVLAPLSLALATCSSGGAEANNESSQGAHLMDGEARQGMGARMKGRMMGDGRRMGGDMAAIRGLLADHEKIERSVKNLPGGVRTVTVSDDPRVTDLIRNHVRAMRERYARGQPIRTMDPGFRELFRRRHQATMAIKDVPGGVEVVHTSDDPSVALLIRQHANRFVSEAAAQGMRRAMAPTPLPESYRAPAD